VFPWGTEAARAVPEARMAEKTVKNFILRKVLK
jgi:hypothetical protein